MSVCGFGGRHLFEHCVCDKPKCRRWICVICDHIVDRARAGSSTEGMEG